MCSSLLANSEGGSSLYDKLLFYSSYMCKWSPAGSFWREQNMGISISTKKGSSKEPKSQKRDSPVGMERTLQRSSSRYMKYSSADSGYPTTASTRPDYSRKRPDDCSSFSDFSLDGTIIPERPAQRNANIGSRDYSTGFGRTGFEEKINMNFLMPDSDEEYIGDADSIRTLYIPGAVMNGSLATRDQKERNDIEEVFHRKEESIRMPIQTAEYNSTGSVERRSKYDKNRNPRSDALDIPRSFSETPNTTDPRNRPGAARAERRRIRSESVPPRTDHADKGYSNEWTTPKTHRKSEDQIYSSHSEPKLSPSEIDLLEFLTKLIKQRNDSNGNSSGGPKCRNGNDVRFGISLTVDPMSEVVKISLPGKLFFDNHSQDNIDMDIQRKRKVKRHQSMFVKSWRWRYRQGVFLTCYCNTFNKCDTLCRRVNFYWVHCLWPCLDMRCMKCFVNISKYLLSNIHYVDHAILIHDASSLQVFKDAIVIFNVLFLKNY